MSVLARIACWFSGHHWRVLRCCNAHHLMHLHPLAGQDADCTRCGATERMYESVRRGRALMWPGLPILDGVCHTCVGPVTEGCYR